MRKVIAEFLTTDPAVPDSYGDSGCMLAALRQTALILRHEHYTDELQHKIYLFAREPELGAQVFLHAFPMPEGEKEFLKELDFYLGQRKDFRLPSGPAFDASVLAPSSSKGFESHIAFRTRDGKYRRRLVHSFVGTKRAMLLVYSLDSVEFLKSAFFNQVSQNLSLADTECKMAS